MSVHKSVPLPYDLMSEQQAALDKLDIHFRWGDFGIRVLKFHWTSFHAGKVVDFHKHAEYELHFIPRGKGKLTLDDSEHQLQAGMFYVTGPGVLHRQEADAHEAMDELCLHVELVRLNRGESSLLSLAGEPKQEAASPASDDWGSGLERSEAEQCVSLLAGLPAEPAFDRHDAMSCFAAAYYAWQEGHPGLFTQLKQLVIQILLKTVSAHALSPHQAELPSRDMNRYRYELAVQFIHANYMQPLTVEHVAERAQISARQLQRVFRLQTGATFGDYLERYRLDQICRQLKESGDSIQRIATANGFASANYLHLVFKRRYGVTPLAYREKQHS